MVVFTIWVILDLYVECTAFFGCIYLVILMMNFNNILLEFDNNFVRSLDPLSDVDFKFDHGNQ